MKAIGLTRGGVVVTFDDGYLDNFTNALPILEELKIPAVFFITTGNIKLQNDFWWDELEQILLVDDTIPDMLNLKDEKYAASWKTDTFSHRKNCYRALHFLMKNCISVHQREQWLKNLWEWKGIEGRRSIPATVSKENIKKMSESEFASIGAHTVSHAALGRMDYKEQEKEIISSIQTLERITGRSIDIFSYPFGRFQNDYNEDTVEICKKAGIKKAVTTENGIWTPECSAWQIPRNIVRDWRLWEYEAAIREYWQL